MTPIKDTRWPPFGTNGGHHVSLMGATQWPPEDKLRRAGNEETSTTQLNHLPNYGPGDVNRHPVDNSMTHGSPTPWLARDRAPQLVAWLTLADRLQLERDLADLPTLAATLERHYPDLLARGASNPDDHSVRYVIDPAVLDLADRRIKDTLLDPAGEADLARRIGARRHGIAPTLAGWVSIAVDEMHRLDVWHLTPTDPDRITWTVDPAGTVDATRPGVTVASEAAWLAGHLDWIAGQQWVVELAREIRDLVADLERLVGPAHATPDHGAVGTITELAASTCVPAATIYRWVSNGWLTPINNTRPRLFVRRDVLSVRHSVAGKPV